MYKSNLRKVLPDGTGTLLGVVNQPQLLLRIAGTTWTHLPVANNHKLKLQTLQPAGVIGPLPRRPGPRNLASFVETDLALSREFHGRAFRESGSPVL